ncbi:MAG: bifunctional nuclease family protein [Deltaproteobacteria bacterium]|nr:bifunctional nuclease family protein [Deltaproteobacteria bacterium]
MKRADVVGILLDEKDKIPVVVLKTVEDNIHLPIWIGPVEAIAIQNALEGVEPARPMTHDLIKNILAGLGADVERIVITDLIDNTFYANIVISIGGRESEIDSRPSDAIAIALRMNAPVFINEEVFNKMKEKLDPDERLKEYLNSLSAEDFGKYKM